MKNLKLLTIVATCLLVTSIFAVIPAFSVQPPLKSDTYYIGTIGGPANLDPARAYDTASGEIIQNVLQALIWYKDKHPITFTSGAGYNMTPSDISDDGLYDPYIATEVPTEGNGRIHVYANKSEDWTFTVNTNAQFQTWVAANTTVMGPHNVTVDDVVYSFQRQMVYDSDLAPTWMWYQPAINPSMYTWSDVYNMTDNAFAYTANETEAGNLIKRFVYASGGNNVTFHFEYPYPHIALYQIFAQTWGSIVEKDWVIERGGWDGSFAAGWSKWYRQTPNDDFSELDLYKSSTDFPGDANHPHPYSYYASGHVPALLGTGPYNFTNWDQTAMFWRLDANDHYWMGWGDAGAKDGINYIKTVIDTEVDAWTTRKMLFLNGEFDSAVVPTSSMHDLLQVGSSYDPLPGIDLAYNIPNLVTDEFFFCTNVSTSTPYPTYVGYPSHTYGPITDFFADIHIRRAFAWAFNYTEYIEDAFFGEAKQHATWWCDGLTPTAANDSWLTPRNYDLAQMMSELDQAALINGHNVSQEGFDLTFPYNSGNDLRRIAVQLLSNAWTTVPGSGGKYHVATIGVTWASFLSICLYQKKVPGYVVGWLADFADAVDFAGVYMASSGSYAGHQGPPFPPDQDTIDDLVSQAATETNATARVNEYRDLEQRYFDNALSLALVQPTGRHWSRDWLQGWYYNPLLPGLYAFDLYKAYPATPQQVTLDLSHSITTIVGYPTTGASPYQVYWYKGKMYIGYNASAPSGHQSDNATSHAVFSYSIFIERTDGNNLVGSLVAAVSLERMNGSYPDYSGYAFPNNTLVYLAPGGNATVPLEWWEDGTYASTFAPWNPLSGVPGTDSALWNMSGYAVPLNATQTSGDESLQSVKDGRVLAKKLPGDFKQTAIITILDDIVIGNVYGETEAHAGAAWGSPIKVGGVALTPSVLMSDCDLKADGIVNILDYIVLGNYFGQTAP